MIWRPPSDGTLTAEQVDLVLAWHGDAAAEARWVLREASEEELAWATGAVLAAVEAEGVRNVEVVRPHLEATARKRATDVGREGVW